MKKNNIYTLILCAGIFLCLITSCSNDVNGKNETQTAADNVYTVSGKIDIEAAVPSNINKLFTAEKQTNRSAISSLTFTSDMSLEVYAKSSATGEKIYQGTITGKQYSIALPSSGYWTITATVIIPSKENEGSYDSILYKDFDITIPDTTTNYTVPDIILEPNYYSNKNGNIDLIIYDDTERVEKVIYYGTPVYEDLIPDAINYFETSTEIAFTNSESGKITEIKGSDIVPQVYNVIFKFLDSNNKVLYSCEEAISIFSGFTTDTWLGDGVYLIKTDNKTEFRITDDLLASYEQVNIPEDVSDAPIVLWNGAASNGESAESVLTEYVDEDYHSITSEIDTSISYVNGINVFGNITADMELGVPVNKGSTASSSTPVFCFDDQGPTNIYVLQNDTIRMLKCSYAGYVYDKSVNVNLNTIINGSGANPDNQYLQIYNLLAYYSDNLYFIFSIDQTKYIGSYNPLSKNFDYTEINFPTSINKVKSLDIAPIDDSVKICMVYEYTDSARFYRDFDVIMVLSSSVIEPLSEAEFSSSTLEISTTDINVTFANENDSMIISDLYIWDNYLYAALCASPNNSSVSKNYLKVEDEYIRKAIIVSNGGIVKIDLSATNLSLETWEKHNTKVLGWYQNEYYDSDESLKGTVTMQPPLDDAENKNYFYGPVKFIARKPDELVIADDGG